MRRKRCCKFEMDGVISNHTFILFFIKEPWHRRGHIYAKILFMVSSYACWKLGTIENREKKDRFNSDLSFFREKMAGTNKFQSTVVKCVEGRR